jgi:glycosyltransferase involved in cell wall biosynthesis
VKILIINASYTKRNGVTAVILNYVKNMDRSNLHIDFVAINEVENDLKNEIETIGKVTALKMRNKNPLKYVYKLSKIIRKGKYSVVHVHGNSCTLAVDLFAVFMGGVKKRIAHCHNTKCEHIFLHKLLRLPLNLLYTHALACSELAGKWLFKNKPFKVLQNAIDLEKYKFNEQKRKEYRAQYNLKDKIAIAHIATLTAVKNHVFILEVLKMLLIENQNYVLFLIGDGVLQNEIENKVKDLGLENNVIFMGSVQNVFELLNAMDLLVLPSLYEGLGIVAIEAQANGLMVLLSDNVPNESKVTELVNFLPLKKEAWTKKIFELKTQEDRVALSESAIVDLKNARFDIKEEAKRLKRIYEYV